MDQIFGADALSTQARLAAIVQSSLDAIVGKSPEGTVTSWNPAATELFGWTPEEMVGRSINVLIPSNRRSEERQLLARVARGERVEPYETERQVKGGGTIHVALTSSPIRNGLGEIEGVASIYRDNGWVRKRERMLQALLETAHDPIIGFGADGIIQVVNRRAEKLFGYERAELIGQKVDLLVPARLEDMRGAERSLPDPAAIPVDGFVLTARAKDGSTFPVDVALSSYETDAGVIGLSVRDISDAVQAAREREELEHQLRRTRLESIGQLVGGIAHDFNNLLAGIMGFATLVKEQLHEIGARDPDVVLDQVAQDVDQILQTTERAASVTRQLLLFGRQEVARPQALDVNKIVGGMEDLLQRTIGEEIRLVTDLGEELPSVHLDPGHFEQTLMNLAVNARDAMPSGGDLSIETGEVSLEPAAATAKGVSAGPFVILSVTDSGTGMTADVAARAFDPYFTTKPRGEGSGLGLAAVYGIVAQSGGHVGLRSAPDEGTTVDVYLPAFG